MILIFINTTLRNNKILIFINTTLLNNDGKIMKKTGDTATK